jgi:hypothetical protein
VWLRALSARIAEVCEGPGVGVIGMCLTGGFMISLMVDPHVLAPVTCEPALPFPAITPSQELEAELGAGFIRCEVDPHAHGRSHCVEDAVKQTLSFLDARLKRSPA